MVSFTIASAVLMGVLLLLVVVAVGRLRHWRPAYRAALDRDGAPLSGGSLRGETVWMLGFFAVTLAFTFGAVALVSDTPGVTVPESFWGLFGFGLLPFLGLLTVLVFGGLYATLRAKGHGQAFATGAGIGVLGTLFVLGVAVKLVLGA